MTLPEGVQAFFLLHAINVSEEHEKLARATCVDLTYENMKANVIKIFGDFSLGVTRSSSCTDTVAIKTEPTFYANHSSENNDVYVNSARPGGSNSNSFSQRSRRSNPRDSTGKLMKCYGCGSTEHFKNRCPRKKQGNTEVVHIVNYVILILLSLCYLVCIYFTG